MFNTNKVKIRVNDLDIARFNQLYTCEFSTMNHKY